MFLTFTDRDEGDDMGCYDAFDLHDLDEEEFDHSESEDNIGGTSSGSKTSLGFGPPPKFSRGDEKYSLNEELKMVEEKRFICSLLHLPQKSTCPKLVNMHIYIVNLIA